MITQQQIENLGFKLVGVSANGGSKTFGREQDLKVLKFHGDNFIYKREHNEKLNEISLEEINRKTYKFELIHKFNTDDLCVLEERLKLHGFL